MAKIDVIQKDEINWNNSKNEIIEILSYFRIKIHLFNRADEGRRKRGLEATGAIPYKPNIHRIIVLPFGIAPVAKNRTQCKNDVCAELHTGSPRSALSAMIDAERHSLRWAQWSVFARGGSVLLISASAGGKHPRLLMSRLLRLIGTECHGLRWAQ